MEYCGRRRQEKKHVILNAVASLGVAANLRELTG